MRPAAYGTALFDSVADIDGTFDSRNIVDYVDYVDVVHCVNSSVVVVVVV